MVPANPQDTEFLKRRYPRREFLRPMGILYQGNYFVIQAVEIGEGGMSFETDLVLDPDHQMVVHFRVPSGAYAFIRAEIKGSQKIQKRILYRLAFVEVELSIRRQIRAYVSAGSQSQTSYFVKAA